MKMEQTECSETSAYKIQMPGNYPKESMQHMFVNLTSYVKSDMGSLNSNVAMHLILFHICP